MGRAVLWLGAGFSRPAGGPVGADLLTEPYLLQSRAEPEFLAALQQLARDSVSGGSPELEDAFSKLWRHANVSGRITIAGVPWDAEKLLQQLRIHLASITGRLRFRANSDLYSRYSTFFFKLLRRSRRLTIITTNYDLVVERLFESQNASLAYGRRGDIHLEKSFQWRRWVIPPKTRVLKLHGSSNWGICDNCDQLTAFGKPYVPSSRRRACEECADGLLDSAIVPPINSKAGELRAFRGAWRLAEEELRQADSLMVIGYSLPAADPEVHSLLSSAALGPASRNTEIVAGSNRETRSRFAQLFPRATWSGKYFEDYLAGTE
jgi:NAD-dependent SIR2 family protein deacetylase